MNCGWIDRPPQLDMPHWWEKLTAIPEVGDPKKLAQKSMGFL